MKRSVIMVWACLCMALSSPALAHHPVATQLPPESGIAQNNLGLRTRVGLRYEVAEFELGDRGAGQWHVARLYGEYLFLDRLAVGASLPLGHIRYRNGARPWGLGDAEVNLRFRFLDALGGRLNGLVGLGVEIPTGSTSDGLGDGHVMLSPQVGLIYTTPSLFSLALTVSDHVGFEGKADTPAAGSPTNRPLHGASSGTANRHLVVSDSTRTGGSVLAPHSEHELRTELTAMYQYRSLYAFVTPSAIVQWASAHPLGPIEIGGGIGVVARSSSRLELQLTAPVYGDARANWRASLGVEFWF